MLEAHLSSPPGQGDVGGAESVVAGPSPLLELEGRRRVDVRDERAEDGKDEHDGLLMAGPLVEQERGPEASTKQHPDLLDDLGLGDPPCVGGKRESV